MTKPTRDNTSRFLNHTEVIYAPGDRALAKDLFRAIGCRVLDPQEEAGPPELGPAAGPYLIIFVDPDATDLIDNVMYASEVTPAQWGFEQELRRQLAEQPQLGEARGQYIDMFTAIPQAMTHFGMAMPEAELEATLDRLRSNPALVERVNISGPYRPGDPGSVDPRVVQAFLHTDIISSNVLAIGQQIELQARVG